MEFLKTCTTNAQAIVRLPIFYTMRRPRVDNHQGDYEAVAYQAFSVIRASSPQPSTLRDWNPSEDIRAVQAELHNDRRLVAQDASRPWLWLFEPTTSDNAGPPAMDLPQPEGYRLQRTNSPNFRERSANTTQVSRQAS